MNSVNEAEPGDQEVLSTKMTKNLPPLPDDLPPGLAESLNTVPSVSEMDIAALEQAGERLDSDPLFQANFLKSLFVEKMLQALEERQQTKAGLAAMLKKSRQYIQKLFNESRRVNFTLETMCEVAHALGHRVHVFVCKEDEEPWFPPVRYRKKWRYEHNLYRAESLPMKSPKPLKPHAVEMLRLIGSICHDGGGLCGATPRYWYPQNRSQISSDAAGVFTVEVGGSATVGAIKTLIRLGYVERVNLRGVLALGQGKYASRITVLGRICLGGLLLPLVAARQAKITQRRAMTQAERDDDNI